MKKIFKYILVSIVSICFFGLTYHENTNYINAAYEFELRNPNIPSGYYDGLDLNASTEDFKETLSDIISKNYVQHSYSYNNTVLRDTDRDPNNPNNIICLYTGRSLSSGWNKEHVWAKSHGFPESGCKSSEPYSDAHHLRPTLNSINSSRSNLDFGEVDGGRSDGYGNKWDSDHFEPRDEVKGDVARMMFYMAIRYMDAPFSLKLVNDSTTEGSLYNGRFGNLNLLIQWSHEDPVSEEEYYRNNIIYRDYQHNRNPFIDHPEFVDICFPNNYVESEPDIDKVNNVISLIDTLPLTITLEDKDLVNQVKAAYQGLNYREQQLITNYDKLAKAITDLNKLENPTQPDNPTDIPNSPDVDETFTDDLTKANVPSGGYNKDVTFTVNSHNYYVSDVYKASNEFRLGNNKSNSVDDIYNPQKLSGDSSSLVMKFNVVNAKYIKVSTNGKYGNINKYQILFSENNGTTYEVIKDAAFKEGEPLYAELDTSKTGRFAVVIFGSTPRLKLSTLEVGIKDETPDINTIDYSDVQTQAGINFKYNWDKEITSLNLFVSTKKKYDGHYINLVIVKESVLNSIGLDNIKSLSQEEAKLKLEEIKENKISASTTDSFTSTITVTNYEEKYVAFGYVLLEDRIFYTKEVTYSVNDIVDIYLQSNLLTGNILDIIKLNFKKESSL